MCCILLAVFIIIGFQISSVDENSSTLESCMDDWVPSDPAPQQWKPNGFAVLALPFSQFATSHKNQNQNNQTLTLSTMINTKPITNTMMLLDSQGCVIQPENSQKRKKNSKRRSRQQATLNQLLEDGDTSESTLVDVYPLHECKTVSHHSKNKTKKSKRSKSKKSVSFKLNKKGDIKTKVKEFEKCEPEGVWWTSQELASFRQSCIGAVKAFEHEKGYVQALVYLYSLAHHDESSEEAQSVRHLKKRAMMQMARYYDDVRGLEMHIHPTASHEKEEYYYQMVDMAHEPGMTASCLKKASKHCTKGQKTFAGFLAELDLML